MSNCIISLNISSFQPSSLNFEGFAFNFHSEGRGGLDNEITYSEKNTIIHKANCRKEIKFNIKVNRDSSLIGISDFTIPLSVLSKKQESFSKLCQVTMTESTKRILFGSNASNNYIKISVNATIQYSDKSVGLKQSHSLPRTKMNKTPLSPKTLVLKNKYIDELNKIHKNNRDINTPPLFGKKPQTAKGKTGGKTKESKMNAITQSIKDKFNFKVSNTQYSSEKKPEKKEEEKEKEKEKEIEKPKEKEFEEQEDLSFIDEVLTKEVDPIDPNFREFIKIYEEKNPLSCINELRDPSALKAKTKDNVFSMLEYQNDYYFYLKKAIDLNNQLRELLLKNNEKYRLFFKKRNRLDEQYKTNEIKNDFIVSLNRGESKEITELIPLKRKEIEVYKKMYNKQFKEQDIKKFLEGKAQKEKREIELQGTLLKLVQNVINKYGPLGKLITKSNSKDEDIDKMKEMISKYNLPNEENNKIREENEDEIEGENEAEHKKGVEIETKDVSENIIGGSLSDSIDVKLNDYLRGFYAKKKLPKLMFKRISAGNYEYGSIKVFIKMEGDSIQIKSSSGVYAIDKFIELNSLLEERKMKLKKENKGNSTTKLKAKAYKA